MESLKAMLEKIPLVPLLLVFAAYLGYDYYTFQTDAASPMIQKQQELLRIRKETATVQEKLKHAQEFFRTLETRREELRTLAIQLEEAKASLSEQMDVSSFIRMVVGEARKLGMTVDSIRPAETHEKEYYVEQSFKLTFHGIYVQFVVFLQRLTELDKIVRVGQADFKPVGPADKNFVQLTGDIQLNTYKYRGSQADDLGKGASAPPQQQQKPGGGK